MTKKLLLTISLLVLFLPSLSQARINTDNKESIMNPYGWTKKNTDNTVFEVMDSDAQNIKLTSNKSLDVKITSIPEIILIDIKKNEGNAKFLIENLKPNTKYYKYLDNLHNLEELTTNNEGQLELKQDVKDNHLIILKTHRSTKFINSTDGGDCSQFGTWDPNTLTCTLTQDVYETIQIDSDGITLDGSNNNYTVTSYGGAGVFASSKQNIVIKNIHFSKYASIAIQTWNVSNSIFDSNIIDLSGYNSGLYFGNNSYSNQIVGNIIVGEQTPDDPYGGGEGIHLGSAGTGNIVQYNQISNVKYLGIFLGGTVNGKTNYNTITNTRDGSLYMSFSDASQCNMHEVIGNTGSNGLPIGFYNQKVDLKDQSFSELYFCGAHGSTLENVNVTHGWGLYLYYSDNISLYKVNSLYNISGLWLNFSEGTTVTSSNFNDNSQGMFIANGDGNTNTIAYSQINNNTSGVFVTSSNNNNLHNNSISNNSSLGINVVNSGNAEIYNNNFVDNYVIGSGGSHLSANLNASPLDTISIHNNYYKNVYSTESCVDANVDGVCDDPVKTYLAYGYDLPVDNSALVNPMDLQAPYITTFNQYTEDGALIPEGNLVNNDSMSIKATVFSPIGGSLKLQAEIIDINSQFTGNPTNTSTDPTSNNVSEIKVSEIKDGSYRWRIRVFNETNNKYSQWLEFGTVNNTDFSISYPLTLRAIKQAHSVFGASYLGDGETWGGKGWDLNNGLYVTSDQIKDGYNYYDARYDAARWGDGVDCSGLVMWSYNRSYDPVKDRLHNAIHDENAQGQFSNSANTYAVSDTEKQPGDLLFLTSNETGLKGHVGIYSGNLVSNVDVVESNISFGVRGSLLSNFKDYQGYTFNPNEDIHRVIPNPQIAAIIQTTSTVNVEITNPDNIMLSKKQEKKQKSDKILQYSHDEKDKETVYWDNEKNGKYKINIVPKEGVSLDKTFSLTTEIKGNKITLLKDIPLNKIAKKGYTLNIEKDKTVLTENQ